MGDYGSVSGESLYQFRFDLPIEFTAGFERIKKLDDKYRFTPRALDFPVTKIV
jgi:hypothetical protein